MIRSQQINYRLKSSIIKPMNNCTVALNIHQKVKIFHRKLYQNIVQTHSNLKLTNILQNVEGKKGLLRYI